MVDTASLGFFVGETPTYKLSSTFERELCSLLIEKSKIKVSKILHQSELILPYGKT
jgi:hypothetical protein